MTGFLLDANMLIALVVAEHEHHDRVVRWAAEAPSTAVCPTSEGALVRFLVRLGEPARLATTVLQQLHDAGVEQVPDDLSYADADLSHVRGHRQVTDAYLAALAAHHGRRLATLDAALARDLPESTLLLPD